MSRLFRTQFVFNVLMIIMLISVYGCKKSPIPEDSYSRFLPEGAEQITEDEFTQRVKDGGVLPVSIRTIQEQEEAAAQTEMDDDMTIADFEMNNPGVGSLVPDDPLPGDPTVLPLGDGNYLHTIQKNDGSEGEVITMGRRWFKNTIARAIRTYPTRENQLTLYREFYNSLTTRWRTSLALVDPALIESNPERYSDEFIAGLNRVISENAFAIIPSVEFDTRIPPGYISDCSQEIGAGTGGDRIGCDYSDPACGFQEDGIVKNHYWPMKYYVTCVKDQAGRGTCTNFANTSAIETWVAKTHGRWVNLSEQAHYNRMKLVWEHRDCGDGMMSDFGFAKMYQEGWLLPFEEQWNYNPSLDRITLPGGCYTNSCVNYSDTCSDSTHQSELVCWEQQILFTTFFNCGYYVPEKNPDNAGYRITTSAQIWDPNDIELSFAKFLLALIFGRPVVLGMPVITSWDNANLNNGFMPYTGPNESNRGGHGTHAVGFIDNTVLAEILPSAPQGAGGGYIIVKNSWGNCWGDGGYLYVPYQAIKEYTADATVLHGVL